MLAALEAAVVANVGPDGMIRFNALQYAVIKLQEKVAKMSLKKGLATAQQEKGSRDINA